MKRHVLRRLPLGADELVLSTDPATGLDIRVWTATAGVRLASAQGFTFDHSDLPAIAEALQAAAREAA